MARTTFESSQDMTEGNVKWDADGSALITLKKPYPCGNRYYKANVAIQNKLYSIVNVIFMDVYKFKNGTLKPCGVNMFDPIRATVPSLGDILTCRAITAKLWEIGVKYAESFLEQHKNDDITAMSISDGHFLAIHGLKRNYRRDCAICLADEIMGTHCTCGHTEIAVFRPCGHSVCAKPCFEQLANSQGMHLKTRELAASGGVVFKILSQKDITTAVGLKCPLCRGIVQKIFRAEDCRVPEEVVPELDSIADDFYKKKSWLTVVSLPLNLL